MSAAIRRGYKLNRYFYLSNKSLLPRERQMGLPSPRSIPLRPIGDRHRYWQLGRPSSSDPASLRTGPRSSATGLNQHSLSLWLRL